MASINTLKYQYLVTSHIATLFFFSREKKIISTHPPINPFIKYIYIGLPTLTFNLSIVLGNSIVNFVPKVCVHVVKNHMDTISYIIHHICNLSYAGD